MTAPVVLGYDSSPGSRAALVVALRVAAAFAAPLAVVFGYEPSPLGGESADYRHQLEQIGDEVVGEAVAEAMRIAPGVEVEPLVVPLRPVDSLLEAARQRQALFIVVGGTGERPIVGAVLGSVPHKLLHLSPVPVLVVPASDEDRR
jgi:nucleotide-binding universal stress UspA family protein